MAIQDLSLPSNLLTTQQYEEQQAASAVKQSNLDRDDFLVLFTTQLKNQNPLDPLENEAFVAQLAQFSTLESMKGMQKSIEDMAAESRSEKFLMGASLLGKKVSVDGGSALAGGGEELSLDAILESSITDAVFSVYDSRTGGLVHKEEFPRIYAGDVALTWDGKNSEGQNLPRANYQFALSGNNGESRVNLPLVVQQKINSVLWDNETQKVQVKLEGGRELSLDELGKIEI